MAARSASVFPGRIGTAKASVCVTVGEEVMGRSSPHPGREASRTALLDGQLVYLDAERPPRLSGCAAGSQQQTPTPRPPRPRAPRDPMLFDVLDLDGQATLALRLEYKHRGARARFQT